jgi:hypothetical protein
MNAQRDDVEQFSIKPRDASRRKTVESLDPVNIPHTATFNSFGGRFWYWNIRYCGRIGWLHTSTVCLANRCYTRFTTRSACSAVLLGDEALRLTSSISIDIYGASLPLS